LGFEFQKVGIELAKAEKISTLAPTRSDKRIAAQSVGGEMWLEMTRRRAEARDMLIAIGL
jgi:hypothetical protein